MNKVIWKEEAGEKGEGWASVGAWGQEGRCQRVSKKTDEGRKKDMPWLRGRRAPAGRGSQERHGGQKKDRGGQPRRLARAGEGGQKKDIGSPGERGG